MKNKSAHRVKWRKRAIQIFDKRWILDYILFITHICIVHKFFIFTSPLFAYWLVPTLTYSTAPEEQILAHLPFETVLTFTENLKIDAFIETATYITNGKTGQYATAYSTGRSCFHHRKFIILYSTRHERVMTSCHKFVPSLNSYSHFCIAPEWPLYTGLRQAVVKLHNFFFFDENSDNFGYSPNKYLYIF